MIGSSLVFSFIGILSLLFFFAYGYFPYKDLLKENPREELKLIYILKTRQIFYLSIFVSVIFFFFAIINIKSTLDFSGSCLLGFLMMINYVTGKEFKIKR